MSPQVVMSLGVTDIEQAKQFYSDVFGWPIEWDHGKFVSFQLGDGTGMALYTGEAVAFDASLAVDGTYRGVTFSWIVDITEQVDEVMAQAERNGATILKPAHPTRWGGYLGYLADPDGNLWKVVERGE